MKSPTRKEILAAIRDYLNSLKRNEELNHPICNDDDAWKESGEWIRSSLARLKRLSRIK